MSDFGASGNEWVGPKSWTEIREDEELVPRFDLNLGDPAMSVINKMPHSPELYEMTGLLPNVRLDELFGPSSYGDRDSEKNPSYDVDKNTGAIVKTRGHQTLDYRPHDRDAWIARGWHYDVDPNTGHIVKKPNYDTLDIRINDRDAWMKRGWHYALDHKTGRIVERSNDEVQPL